MVEAFTPMQPVYPAEVVSNRMRAKAMVSLLESFISLLDRFRASLLLHAPET